MIDPYQLAFGIIRNILHDIESLPENASHIVKHHTGHQLCVNGDLSFPLLAQRWAHLAVGITTSEPNATIFNASPQFKNQTTEECLDALVSSLQPTVSRMLVQNGRVLVFLNCAVWFAAIDEVIRNGQDYGRATPKDRKQSVMIVIRDELRDGDDVQPETSERNVSDYRCRLVRDVLRNLIGYSNMVLGQDGENNLTVVRWLVSHRQISGAVGDDCAVERIIHCGICRGAGQMGKKKTDITTAKYISIRRQHMAQIAHQKYEGRILETPECIEQSRTMGMASVVFDLLEVKHSSPATLSTEDQLNGSSKGASFILYNSARIDNLVSSYRLHIKTGHYPTPIHTEIDWSLLKEEEEWQLMYNYVLEFPHVVRRALLDDPSGNIAGPHLICNFLSGLVNVFSIYYRRVRILDHNRDHLMDTLHCRMKLIVAVQIVMNKALALLNLQPMRNV